MNVAMQVSPRCDGTPVWRQFLGHILNVYRNISHQNAKQPHTVKI